MNQRAILTRRPYNRRRIAVVAKNDYGLVPIFGDLPCEWADGYGDIAGHDAFRNASWINSICFAICAQVSHFLQTFATLEIRMPQCGHFSLVVFSCAIISLFHSFSPYPIAVGAGFFIPATSVH
tara:strand:+ start:7094 stop:7465 length:372 start_codon:yes stop_codon:yes gene_type:complete